MFNNKHCIQGSGRPGLPRLAAHRENLATTEIGSAEARAPRLAAKISIPPPCAIPIREYHGGSVRPAEPADYAKKAQVLCKVVLPQGEASSSQVSAQLGPLPYMAARGELSLDKIFLRSAPVQGFVISPGRSNIRVTAMANTGKSCTKYKCAKKAVVLRDEAMKAVRKSRDLAGKRTAARWAGSLLA
ncbi:hypothetical protein K438DRAFT_1782617 [Mycena galopus ATCC 62051]|nr:hypothetical protein K438DRAFT_1782617 [Mycena galopus ATCC 62051]